MTQARSIFDDERVYVIAEVGNNHNGSIDLARALVDAAIDAGVDAVKFQIRDRAALYRTRSGPQSEDLGVEYIQDLLSKVELTLEEHRALRAYCDERGIAYICTPWDEPSVDVLAGMNVEAIKIASADLCNPYLIARAATLGKPMLLSTGMSFEAEIVRAVEQMDSLDVPYVVLHCNSTYPAPEADIQLGYIRRLQEFHPHVGYSGHERGISVTLAAVAVGARVVERHISLDRSMEGPDHLASLEPEDFRALVDGIRQIELALPWSGPGRHVSQGELLNRENLGKSVVASRAIARGTPFTEEMFQIRSPGQGLAPYRLVELVGRNAARDIAAGDFLYESDLHDTQRPERLNFNMPIRWGVPVRYHDFLEYQRRINPDLYEFHLSYRDLSVDPAPLLCEVACSRLVVHAPELFEHSELLDLATDDEQYRARAIDNLQRVVHATEQIAEFFPAARDRLIVANVGGISADAPFPVQRRPLLYQRFYESLEKIDFGTTELITQNMAPFPWHLGGQRHQNIFMMPDEMVEQAQRHKLRYTLDLSHLSMTCSHFELDFQEQLAALLPFTAHLHVGDAAGTNGEGVEMGEGDIDWPVTWAAIRAYPDVSFVPETWQGHKDGGAGFWSSLRFLEALDSRRGS